MESQDAPLLYRVGTALPLNIHKSFTGIPALGPVSATITEVFSVTMQPVVRVSIPTPSGTLCLVLKLYDRRCGSITRDIGGKVVQHTEDAEAAYQSFVRSGEMELFVNTLTKEKLTSICVPGAYEFYEEDSPESLARFEAALWMQSNEYFDCETRVYTHLRDLQGSVLPRLYAVASLDMSRGGAYNIPEDLCHGPLSTFFDTKALLLEYIPGPALRDLPFSDISCRSTDPTRICQTAIQEAVNAVHEISRRGVILEDCSPSNAVVNQHTQRVVLIDFTQCTFRDDKINDDINILHYNDEPGWDPDVSYWDAAFCTNGTGAVGSVMALRCKQVKGMKLAIVYPDREKIRKDVVSKKIRWGKDGYNMSI